MPLGSTYIFYSLAGRGPGSLAPCKQAPAATIYARLRPLPPLTCDRSPPSPFLSRVGIVRLRFRRARSRT